MTTRTRTRPTPSRTPASDVLDDLRAIPVRFWAVALLGSALVLATGRETAWVPFTANTDSLQGTGWGSAAGGLALVVLTAVPLVALRLPLLAAATAFLPFIATAFDAQHTWPFTVFLALYATTVVAVWTARRQAILVAGLTLLPVVALAVGATELVMPYGFEVQAATRDRDNLVLIALYAVVILVGLAAGEWMRRSFLESRRAAELEARASDVEHESSVLTERARLAHDLHDIVAHHVSLIAVRAETAPYTVPDLSPGGKELMTAIADDSRRALDELRGVLGVLRRSDGEGDTGPGLLPQPGTTDLERLVEECRRAGSTIDLEVEGLDSVPAAVGYVVYRVVQEALTNARRHASGSPIEVSVRGAGATVVIRVVNDAPAAVVRPGGGLTGMRERVEALGGSLSVTAEEGRFVVEARL